MLRLLNQPGDELFFGLGHRAFFDNLNELNSLSSSEFFCLNRPNSREHRDSFPAAAAMQEHRKIGFISHNFQKFVLSCLVRKIIRPVYASIDRQFEVFNTIVSDPGYFLVVPVFLAMFGCRTHVYDSTDVIFVKQASVIHSSGLTAGIKHIRLDNMEIFDVKMPD